MVLNNIGLSGKPGYRKLFYNAEGSELASLNKRRLDHFGIDMKYSEQVQIETLDSYCETRRVSRIDLLKLDAEGHELEILQGASSLLEQRAIRLVSFEFGGCNIDSRTFVQDFFYFFKEYSMRLARVTPTGYFDEILSYREALEQFQTTTFIAFIV